MGQIGLMIADAASVGLRYGKRLLESIPDDRFARLAAPGGEAVQANHPAFVIGHLALYPSKVLDLLGMEDLQFKPSPRFVELFAKDCVCTDDSDGSKYPAKSEILSFYQSSYDAALKALREADDASLLAANPVDSPIKQICPSLGSMLAFYMTGHVMSHLGQISTWRRMEGMPPA